MRSHDQPLDFDLELAKSRSNDNPVYYMQYAHARVASVMKQLAARGLSYDAARRRSPAWAARQRARGGGARRRWRRYPEIAASRPRCSARRTRWCISCASSRRRFHTWYNAAQFIVEDAATAQRALGARARRAAGHAQRARAARRQRAGEHVSHRRLTGARLQGRRARRSGAGAPARIWDWGSARACWSRS